MCRGSDKHCLWWLSLPSIPDKMSRMLAVAKEGRVKRGESFPLKPSLRRHSCLILLQKTLRCSSSVCGGGQGVPAVADSERNEIFLTFNAVFWEPVRALIFFLEHLDTADGTSNPLHCQPTWVEGSIHPRNAEEETHAMWWDRCESTETECRVLGTCAWIFM